ncbi:uncharacterized protein TNCV_1161921 [Trichonephila clavipes]|nr:uncharacterized protein TNCV_1161921 [Trichonephila clavipes]
MNRRGKKFAYSYFFLLISRTYFVAAVAEWYRYRTVACFVTGSSPVPLKTPRAVASLVVRTPDSGPDGLASIPVPPNSLRVNTEYILVKSVGPKVLWAESRVRGTAENFPPLQYHAKIVEIDGGAIYRPFENFTELNLTVPCMVLKAKATERRTSSPLPR